EAHGPAHDLQTLAVRRRDERRHVELRDLGGDLDGMARGIKGADRCNPTAPADAGLPKGFLAHPIGGYHTQAGNDDTAHDPDLWRVRSSQWNARTPRNSTNRRLRKSISRK